MSGHEYRRSGPALVTSCLVSGPTSKRRKVYRRSVCQEGKLTDRRRRHCTLVWPLPSFAGGDVRPPFLGTDHRVYLEVPFLSEYLPTHAALAPATQRARAGS